MADFRHKYLESVVENCGRLEPRGIPQTVRHVTLPLDEVYVSLTATRERIPHKPEKTVPPAGSMSGTSAVFTTARMLEWEDVTQQSGRPLTREEADSEIGLYEFILSEQSQSESSAPITLPNAVSANSRLILLGMPGSGKTTVTRYLAALFARTLLNGTERVFDKESADYGTVKLPIRVRVADYADAFRKDHSLRLDSFLATGCGCSSSDRERTKILFEESLSNGQTLLLLDGLDEVADVATRVEIARQIEMLITTLQPGNQVLVTSRIAGYGGARLDSRFVTLTLQDLEPKQIEQFLRRWCVAVERFHDNKASPTSIEERGLKESDALIQAIEKSDGVKRLAVNPLLLTILALIQRNKTRLPEHRVELYKTATAALLRDWRVANAGAEGREVTVVEEESLLWPLALWMHKQTDTGRISEREARDKLRELYAEPLNLKSNHPSVIFAVDDLLKRLTEHSGLFVSYSPDEYGFLHLTFEEFLAGQALVSDFEEAADALRPLRHKPRWEEPLRLAIASRNIRDAAKLIKRAIWCPSDQRVKYGYEPSSLEDILHRDLFLATRCISDCAGTEPALGSELAEGLVQLCLDPASNPYLSLKARESLGTLRQTLVGELAGGLLLTALISDQSNVRSAAALALQIAWQGSSLSMGVVIGLLLGGPDLRTVLSDVMGIARQRHSEAVVAITSALKDEDFRVRVLAAGLLGMIGRGHPKAISGLNAALQDDNLEVRIQALEAFGVVGQVNAETVTLLVAALKDDEPSIRTKAADALGTIGQGNPDALACLIAALSDVHSNVRSAAALALGTAGKGNPETVGLLISVLKNNDAGARDGAIIALGMVGKGNPDAVGLLIEALKDISWTVRYVAAEALGTLGQGNPEAVSSVSAMLKDHDLRVRSVAAKALGIAVQGNPDMFGLLIAGLKDDDSAVRSGAARALGIAGMHNPETIRLLITLVDDDSDVRSAALEALGRIGQDNPRVVRLLIAGLKDENSTVRSAAALALGSARDVKPETVGLLIAMLKDDDSTARSAAWRALWDIHANTGFL